MFIVEVTPFSKSSTIGTLSYYSTKNYPEGSIIEIPIRKKTIQGLVTHTKPVSAAKTAIKAATFSLKKIPPQNHIYTLPQSVLDTAHELEKTLPTHTGNIIFALLPPDIRAGLRSFPQCPTYKNEENHIPTILCGTNKDRFIAYKSHIRQAFAHRGSVLFIVPNSASVSTAKKNLEHGIEKRVITFSSTHNKKQLQASYDAFSDMSTAKLIITTPNFALLDRADITTIIIEESGSSHYKSRTRPYLDARDVLKTYAKVTKRSILLGDILPRTEEEILRRNDIYDTYDEHPKRLSFGNTFTISQHKGKDGEKNLKIFTDETIETIHRTLKNKKRVFLYSARRGIAPLVLCYDCGYIFRCPDSGTPYSLLETGHGENMKRWFISSTSGKKVRASDTCPDCGSWRLREQGIGIQQVTQNIQKTFKETPIIVFDHTTATTYNKAKKLIKQFYDAKGSILIGTSMVFPYIDKQIETSIITSYEATRAIPTWRAEETLLVLLLTLRNKTSDECLVQTRSEKDYILKYAQKGQLAEFYNEEIMMRTALSYPPFSTFILLSWVGTSIQVKKIQEYIISVLPHINIQFYNTPLPTKKGITRNALIRIPQESWPDEKLIHTLRTLPPSIRIEVNPDKIV